MTVNGIPPTRSGLLAVLSEAILDNRYPPGTKLPSERVLSEEHGLSRPIVREALRSLAERGLIIISPGRGAFVRTAGTDDLSGPMDVVARQHGATARHLVEARDMLERRTSALAAERATEDEIFAMSEALSAFDRATSVYDRARSDLAFHALVARAAHNPVVEIMFGAIAPLIFEMQLRSLDDHTVTAQGAPLHHEILEAIKQRRPDDARNAMNRHVTLAYHLYGTDLDATLDSIARRKVASIFGATSSLEEVIASALRGDEHP